MEKEYYTVTVTETLQREVQIPKSDAEDEYAAIEIVLEQYRNEDIVLDYEDYVETVFECGKARETRGC